MKFVALIFAALGVAALPLSKISATSGCCYVPPVEEKDKCAEQHCFGAFKPTPEHQDCMNAHPPFEDSLIAEAWQAGCWCVEEDEDDMTCQRWCDHKNTENIRILKATLNPKTGVTENEWYETTVGAAVRQPPTQFTYDAREMCKSACAARGVCSDHTYTWGPTPASLAIPTCTLPAETGSFTYGGDATICAADGNLKPGDKCQINAAATFWCRQTYVQCVADGYAVKLDFGPVAEDEVSSCTPITEDPTHHPTNEPTAIPTTTPTVSPTFEPTMEPIDSPTLNGCPNFNNMPVDCDAASSMKCSYSAKDNACKECVFYTDLADCAASSMCGSNFNTNQCQYCADLDSESACQQIAGNGCQWDGSVCQSIIA